MRRVEPITAENLELVVSRDIVGGDVRISQGSDDLALVSRYRPRRGSRIGMGLLASLLMLYGAGASFAGTPSNTEPDDEPTLEEPKDKPQEPETTFDLELMTPPQGFNSDMFFLYDVGRAEIFQSLGNGLALRAQYSLNEQFDDGTDFGRIALEGMRLGKANLTLAYRWNKKGDLLVPANGADEELALIVEVPDLVGDRDFKFLHAREDTGFSLARFASYGKRVDFRGGLKFLPSNDERGSTVQGDWGVGYHSPFAAHTGQFGVWYSHAANPDDGLNAFSGFMEVQVPHGVFGLVGGFKTQPLPGPDEDKSLWRFAYASELPGYFSVDTGRVINEDMGQTFVPPILSNLGTYTLDVALGGEIGYINSGGNRYVQLQLGRPVYDGERVALGLGGGWREALKVDASPEALRRPSGALLEAALRIKGFDVLGANVGFDVIGNYGPDGSGARIVLSGRK